VGIGGSQKFELGGIKTNIECHDLDLTEVEFSGQDLVFAVRTNDFTVSTEGNVEKGKIRMFLRGENDTVEIEDERTVRTRIKVTHTRHDGSTGEKG